MVKVSVSKDWEYVDIAIVSAKHKRLDGFKAVVVEFNDEVRVYYWK